MVRLIAELDINRCPYCNVDKPSLRQRGNKFTTTNFQGKDQRHWLVYACSRCGGVVTASAYADGGDVQDINPKPILIDKSIPEPANNFLQQAIDTLHAPAGSVMLSASSVDAMLKTKGYIDGTLYTRINKAAADHLITVEMSTWAHEIRLDSNDQRHADEDASLPTVENAQKCVDFALALGEFLFVLPSRVKRGLESVSITSE